MNRLDKEIINIDKQRSEIIHDNFFQFLDKSGKTFTKYAADNHINKTISSKWKSGESKMTVDHIFQAAKYFDVTVNDLFYSAKEKDRIQVISKGKYDPILAQKNVTIRVNQRLFNNLTEIFLSLIFLILVFSIFTVTLDNNLWIMFSAIFIIGIRVLINYLFVNKEVFIINYLDYIYYKRDNNLNTSFKYHILSLIITIVISLIMITLMTYKKEVTSLPVFEFRIILLLITALITKLYSLFFLKRKLEIDISDNEFQSYWISLFSESISFLLVLMSVFLANEDINSFWIMIGTVIIFVSQTIELSKISRSFSEYKLVYEEDEKETRILFKD